MVLLLGFGFIWFNLRYFFDVITWFARIDIQQSFTSLWGVVWDSCWPALIFYSKPILLVYWRWLNLLKLLINLFSDNFWKLISLDLQFIPQLAEIGLHFTWLLLVFDLIQNILKDLVFLNLSYVTLLDSSHYLKRFL